MKVRGNLSGSTLTVDQLRNCDTINTDANGNLACGTDANTQFTNTGSLQNAFDNRYVNQSGDTMTGALRISNNAGLNASGSLLTNSDITLNSDNGATDAVLTFGNSTASQMLKFSHTNQRFEFTKDLYITGALGVTGALSGVSLNVNTTAAIGGAATFNGVATHNANVKVRGNLSGSTLTVDQLRNCDTINTDANGNLACGTDANTQFTNTGSLQNAFDNRYVNQSGDTMTGALRISNNAGLNASGSLLTNSDITLNSDNGATDAVLTFGNSTASQMLKFSHTNQRFEFTKDLYITGALGVTGALSGVSLNVNTTAAIGGAATFNGVATHNANVKVRGNLSGSTLTVDQLRSCNTIDTDSNGNLSCGTDSSGTQFSNTGSLEAYFNSKFVNVSGDTMTGTLRIANNAGLNTSGSLLTNTDITVNSDNGATDATVTFGNSTLAQTLKFSHANQRFELSKDIRVLGTMSGRGLYVKGIADIQATGTAGGVADGGAVRLGHGQDNGIVFRAQSNGSNRTGMFLSGAALYVGAAGSNGFYNATNVTLGGNVGVGTATPGSKLSVSGSVIIGANGNLSSAAADAGVALEVLGFMSGRTLNVSGSGAKFNGQQYYMPGSIAGGTGAVLKAQSNGQLYWGTVSGGSTTFQTVTNASASATGWDYTVLVTAGAATRTITLPTAVGNAGHFIEVKKIDAGTGSIVIDGFGSEEIDTGSGVTISNQGGSVVLRSDGTNVKLVADTAAYAAEYGSNLTITDAQTTTSTSNADVTGGSFTLPSAGTWRVTVNLNTAITAGAAGDVSLLLTDSNNAAVAGSYITLRGEANGSFLSATREVFITTTQVATYKLRWRVGSGDTATIYNDANSSTNIAWEKVGGFQPVVGQSVDFLEVSLATNQTVNTSAKVPYSAVVAAGGTTIFQPNGEFLLKAGKTYRLQGAVSITTSSTLAHTFQWYNVTAGAYFGGTARSISPTTSTDDTPQGVASAIITPTVDTTVRLDYTGGAASVTALAVGTWANVTQLGSTATTSTPKVLVLARDSSTQTISNNATTTITWNTEATDTTSSFNAGTGIFTAPRAGFYRVSFGLSFSAFSTTASNYGRAYVEVNNSAHFGQEWRVDTANTILPFFTGSHMIQLSANDTVRVTFHNSGLGTQYLAGSLRDNWFSIEEVTASY